VTGIEISVLCPTRHRPELLRRSYESLVNLAADPGQVELMTATDPDDSDFEAGHPYDMEQTIWWTAPERYGYQRLHEYYNALARYARGQWLMLWNDDAVMLTPGWDAVIHAQQPGVLWPLADYAPGINTFPLLPAAWAHHLGHVSLDQSADMWVYEIGRLTGTQRRIPVTVLHERVMDQTSAERDAVATVASFHRPEMYLARAVDAEMIRGLL
jgi:hypothetical protein